MEGHGEAEASSNNAVSGAGHGEAEASSDNAASRGGHGETEETGVLDQLKKAFRRSNWYKTMAVVPTAPMKFDDDEVRELRDSTAADLEHETEQRIFPALVAPLGVKVQKHLRSLHTRNEQMYHCAKKVAVSATGKVFRAPDDDIEAYIENRRKDPRKITPAGTTPKTWLKGVQNLRLRQEADARSRQAQGQAQQGGAVHDKPPQAQEEACHPGGANGPHQAQAQQGTEVHDQPQAQGEVRHPGGANGPHQAEAQQGADVHDQPQAQEGIPQVEAQKQSGDVHGQHEVQEGDQHGGSQQQRMFGRKRDMSGQGFEKIVPSDSGGGNGNNAESGCRKRGRTSGS